MITVEQAVKKPAIFIDTRTPAEFDKDHLPKAINIPILSNEERAIVGTIYKESKDQAIEKGIEYFSNKLPNFIKQINEFKDEELIIYCWRGGMRSRAVTALLDSLNYNVQQMEGGYKAYRAHVRDRLDNYTLNSNIVVLWGLTCTGKTELIQKVPNSIDLEGLAQHRSSLYGAIGLKPNSQKRFDNLFLQKLDQLNGQTILVEGESRKIGNVQIPSFFYKAMLKGTHVLLQQDMDSRAKFAIKEYDVKKNLKQIIKVTESLFKVISKENKEQIVNLLRAGKYEDGIKILLEFYYDPLYSHTLESHEYALKIENEGAVEQIIKIMQGRK